MEEAAIPAGSFESGLRFVDDEEKKYVYEVMAGGALAIVRLAEKKGRAATEVVYGPTAWVKVNGDRTGE